MQCEMEIKSSIGKILIYDHLHNYQESVDFCKENYGVLAPTQSQEIIDEIATKIDDCYNFGYGSHEYRYYQGFRVGLKTLGWQGEWSNGDKYNQRKSGKLFRDTWKLPDLSHCHEAYLVPRYKKLFSRECRLNTKSKFLCWVDPDQKLPGRFSRRAGAVAEWFQHFFITNSIPFAISLAIGIIVFILTRCMKKDDPKKEGPGSTPDGSSSSETASHNSAAENPWINIEQRLASALKLKKREPSTVSGNSEDDSKTFAEKKRKAKKKNRPNRDTILGRTEQFLEWGGGPVPLDETKKKQKRKLSTDTSLREQTTVLSLFKREPRRTVQHVDAKTVEEEGAAGTLFSYFKATPEKEEEISVEEGAASSMVSFFRTSVEKEPKKKRKRREEESLGESVELKM